MDHQDLHLDPDNTGKNDEVIISDEELELLDEDTSKKIKTLSAQKKHWREKAVNQASGKSYRELYEESKKATPPPVTPPANSEVPPVQTVDAEAVARKVAMEMKREEYLGSLPEDKRNTVKEVFNSITTGKELNVQNFNDYMSMACRAVGVETNQNISGRITSFASGSVPPTNKPGPTPEQAELAKKAGLNPDEVYGEKVDYSNMLNAHKFSTDNKDEFN
jgi:hypothetical protein